MGSWCAGLADLIGAMLIDFKYSEGLIKVSVSDGDGNLGGMKGRAKCLFNKLGLLLACVTPPCSMFKCSAIASPMSAGSDSGRLRRACPTLNKIHNIKSRHEKQLMEATVQLNLDVGK